METKDWLTVVAVLLSPLIALQVQKWLDEWKDRGRRRTWIFYTLMATRRDRLAVDHVNALNRIDLDFVGEKKVTDAWKAYRDHLGHPEEGRDDAWGRRSEDLFVELLFVMSSNLRHKFDRVDLRRGAYTPQAHGEDAVDNIIMRKALLAIATGQRGLKVDLSAVASGDAAQAEADSQAMKEVFKGVRPLLVQVVPAPHPAAPAAGHAEDGGNGARTAAVPSTAPAGPTV